jgi:spermidine synthase
MLASGFSALVYQVLWLKDLSTLFGNTAQASSVGLCVFFAGLAAGSHAWGRRTPLLRCPLRTYGWLELAIAATASLCFWLFDLYRVLYEPLFAAVGASPALFVLAKTALASAVLFPPAFFMGGTLPVLGHAAIGSPDRLGDTGALLYGLNILGAAAGALAAGFYLPALLGFQRTYLTAIGINVMIAAAAFVLAAAVKSVHRPDARRTRRASSQPLPRFMLMLAAASGFLTLSLQVVAVRLFAQVLQNSVYTVSSILAIFLLSLAAGALAASRLARLAAPDPRITLAAVITISGIAVATIPFTFTLATGGLQYVATDKGWGAYLSHVFGTTALVLAVPCAAVGIVFPFLLRIAQERRFGPGHALGTLGAWNMLGAIAGSAATGFIVLPILGLWGTLQLIAAAYLMASVLCYLVTAPSASRLLRLAPLAGLGLLVTILNPTRLPILRADTARGERVLELRESVYGVTAVVERGGDRRIKVNNYYSLGGSAALEEERNQALIPLMTHPQPRQLFFLGMGTGITAGAAVQPFVQRIVVTELIPDVAAVARRHFQHEANGLFEDPRVEIVVADGRAHLAGTRDRYDLIVSDLFVPWEAGTASVYTHEHFTTARERLAPGGTFVQWLPLYQMSKREFLIVSRTMLDVFPDVTMWRGDFFAERPIVALVGSLDLAPLDPRVIAERARTVSGRTDMLPETAHALTLPFYMGNLARARHLVPDVPLNTDDRPVLEYIAPVTHRQQRIGAARWFNAFDLLAFSSDLLAAVPPEADPYLARLDSAQRDWVWTGHHRYARVVRQSAERPQDVSADPDENASAGR